MGTILERRFIDPEDCATPGYHNTHRYCPNCSWAEPQDPNSPGYVLVKITLPHPIPAEVGQEQEIGQEMELQARGWFSDAEVYGPAPRATCEAAGAKVDQETHTFTVTEVRSLDDLPNDILGDTA